MSQRQEKLRIRIRVALGETEAAKLKLRSALIAGESCGPVRCEIDDLHRRIDAARVELSEIAAAESDDRAARMSEMATTMADEAEAKIKATVDRLRPPANPETMTERNPL
jgi:hypothetical protein